MNRRVGLSKEGVEQMSPEQKKEFGKVLRERTLKSYEDLGKMHGLEGEKMDTEITNWANSPYFAEHAQRYAVGYVKGRETRGRGRRRKHSKKQRKTRRHSRK